MNSIYEIIDIGLISDGSGVNIAELKKALSNLNEVKRLLIDDTRIFKAK